MTNASSSSKRTLSELIPGPSFASTIDAVISAQITLKAKEKLEEDFLSVFSLVWNIEFHMGVQEDDIPHWAQPISVRSSPFTTCASYHAHTHTLHVFSMAEALLLPRDSYALFSNFTSLVYLPLSYFDPTQVVRADSLFEECSSLKELDFSTWYTPCLSSMRDMFAGCSSLTSLNLENIDVRHVMDLSYLFSGCTHLKQIQFSSWRTPALEIMRGVFRHCAALKEVDLSAWDTFHVIEMSELFSGCYRLTHVDLHNFDTCHVNYMESFFLDCKNLKTVNLSSFSTHSLQSMRHFMQGCSSLKEVDLTSMELTGAVDRDYFLTDAHIEKALYLGTYEVLDLGEHASAYWFAANVNCIVATEEVCQSIYYDESFNQLQHASMKWINPQTHEPILSLPDTNFDPDEAYLVIGPEFSRILSPEIHMCKQIHFYVNTPASTMPKQGKELSSTDCAASIKALYDPKTEKINIYTTAKEINMPRNCDHMFDCAFQLKSLDLRPLYTLEIESARHMFSSCHSLSTLRWGENTPVFLKHTDYMFVSTAFKKIDLSKWTFYDIETAVSMFDGCYQLEKLKVPFNLFELLKEDLHPIFHDEDLFEDWEQPSVTIERPPYE